MKLVDRVHAARTKFRLAQAEMDALNAELQKPGADLVGDEYEAYIPERVCRGMGWPKDLKPSHLLRRVVRPSE
jgi:hypothetical protein